MVKYKKKSTEQTCGLHSLTTVLQCVFILENCASHKVCVRKLKSTDFQPGLHGFVIKG